MFRFLLFLLAFLSAQETYDIVIANGNVIDGSGVFHPPDKTLGEHERQPRHRPILSGEHRDLRLHPTAADRYSFTLLFPTSASERRPRLRTLRVLWDAAGIGSPPGRPRGNAPPYLSSLTPSIGHFYLPQLGHSHLAPTSVLSLLLIVH